MANLLLESSGVEIQVREHLGRILEATEDYDNLFAIVIRELPAINWKSGSGQVAASSSSLSAAAAWNEKEKEDLIMFENFLDAFTNTPNDLKSKIFTLYHPPLDSPSSMIVKLKPIAERLALSRKEQQYDAELIHKLLAIIAMNAHQYYGHKQQSSNGDLHQHEQVQAQVQALDQIIPPPPFRKNNTKTGLALYLYGSMVQHSCDPNTSYTSQTHDGALEYKVVRPIKKGDAISFSYIADLYQTPTFERRKLLQHEKNFLCMCDRCCGADYCRVARCSVCQDLVPTKSNLKSTMWQCIKGCDNQTAYNDSLEGRYRELLTHVKSTLRADTSTDPLYNLIKVVTKNLSPTHYIAIRGWIHLSTLYASKAAEKHKMIQMAAKYVNASSSIIEQTNRISQLSVEELRQKAALTGLRAVSLIECVANKCTGCKPGCTGTGSTTSSSSSSKHHTVVHDSSSRMFHACIDLMDIPLSMYPPDAKVMVRRYMPLLYGTFGKDDKDIKKIEKVILSDDISSSTSSSTADDTTTCRQCDQCKQLKEKLFACSRCNLAWYCGRDCQVKHWKVVHKKECVS